MGWERRLICEDRAALATEKMARDSIEYPNAMPCDFKYNRNTGCFVQLQHYYDTRKMLPFV